MRRRISGTHAALLAATLLLLAGGQAAAQEVHPLSGGLTLTDMTLVPPSWWHGMIEWRFVIGNPTAQTLPVEITMPASTYRSEGIAGVSQTVLANAGTRTQATLHQPPVRLAGHNASVRVARHRPETISCRTVYPSHKQGTYSAPRLSLLVSKGLSAEELKASLEATAPVAKSGGAHFSVSQLRHLSHDQVVSKMFTREAMKEINPLRFEGEGAAWPRHWLAYSAFDGCLIAAADFERMPEEARNALRDYAAIGGHVTFMGMDTLPEGWETREPAREIILFMRTDTLPEGGETGVQPGLRPGGIGFGHAGTLPVTDFTAIATNDLARLAGDWIATMRPWLTEDSTSALLKAIPVVGNIRVPARSFLLILLVFALLAGPGAVFYTRRANRRLWLLAIVPAFSLLFSLVIVVYALLSEGTTPSQHRQAVTLLDQTRRHAATVGAVGIYAPVSLRDGLHFDHGTEITPLSAVNSGRIAIGQGQHYAAGWVRPRLPVFFTLRRSETRAERLVVSSTEPGTVEVVNALGAPILRLQLCDARGDFYETRDLAAGERRTLVTTRKGQPYAFYEPSRIIRLPAQQATDGGWHLNDLIKKALTENDHTLAPAAGSYVAVLDGAPFLEDPLAYCRTRGAAQSIVVGWPGTE